MFNYSVPTPLDILCDRPLVLSETGEQSDAEGKQ